jgi:uncharacterized protein (TIGR03435 family)
MRAAVALLLLLAQATPAFEVVAIKPGDEKSTAPFRGTTTRGNRWIATRVTLRTIIRDAYETAGFDMPDRVVGGPEWLDKDQFDITATATFQPTQAQLEPMLRAMLTDRFHVTSHVEKRTLPAYALVPARRDSTLGPKLQRTEADCRPRCGVAMMYGATERMISSGVEMTRFAFVLSTVLRRPVIDRTGLTGSFKLTMEFAPNNEPASDAPSLFTALEEQLFLKLQSVKEPLDVLVVDRAEKPSFD